MQALFCVSRAIFQAIRFRPDRSRERVALTNACTPLINQNGFVKPNFDVALHPNVAAAMKLLE